MHTRSVNLIRQFFTYLDYEKNNDKACAILTRSVVIVLLLQNFRIIGTWFFNWAGLREACVLRHIFGLVCQITLFSFVYSAWIWIFTYWLCFVWRFCRVRCVYFRQQVYDRILKGLWFRGIKLDSRFITSGGSAGTGLALCRHNKMIINGINGITWWWMIQHKYFEIATLSLNPYWRNAGADPGGAGGICTTPPPPPHEEEKKKKTTNNKMAKPDRYISNSKHDHENFEFEKKLFFNWLEMLLYV